MRASELYIGRPELMSPEELEENDFADHTAKIPMIPPWYRKRLFETIRMVPDEQNEDTFRTRRPAMGLSREELNCLRHHATSILPVQQRLLFRMLQNTLVVNLISCDGASSIGELLAILEGELERGGVSPIPEWYSFKRASERGYGYHVCSARGCFRTESLYCRFKSCGDCRVAYYCGGECQSKDWKERHKFICSDAKRIVGKDGERQYLEKLLKDPNVIALLERRGK